MANPESFKCERSVCNVQVIFMRTQTKVDFNLARTNMVKQQVRAWDVSDPRILEPLSTLPREHFIPEAYRGVAYADTLVPIGYGEWMLPAKVVGRLLQALHLDESDAVLEIGTGTGYVTALLAHLVKSVVSVEIIPQLAHSASQILPHLDIQNVAIEVGDGLQGPVAAGAEPFDAIVLTGSVPCLPKHLRERLAINGRLFAVIGEPPVMSAVLLTRLTKEYWTEQSVFETVIPPLQHAPRLGHFVL